MLEGGEADRLGLAGLEDRQIGEGEVDALGELGQRHALVVQPVVEGDDDRHQTVPSSSSRISVPTRNTRARMNSSKREEQPAERQLLSL